MLLLFKRQFDATYLWLSLLLVAHLVFRGLLVCADERYELPIDLLLVWWVVLTLRGTARATRTASS